MSALEALLVARIRREGPMTFRDFMAQALYHPGHGYYTSGKPWRGRGDFATAPRYGEAFALGLARFLQKAKAALGPGAFEAVEVGAGSGQLLAQLDKLLAGEGVRLRAVDHRRPPLLPSGVPWSASVRGLAVRGVLFSNELFDALPVHRVTRAGGELREQWVAAPQGVLVAEWGAPSRPEVAAYLARFRCEPPEGHVVEVGLDALALLRELARALDEGVLLTIDYGHGSRELLGRADGTLVAARDHRLAEDPLAAPGEQDLTAHVNFTALAEEGRALGLEPLAELAQWEFLAAMGVLDDLARGLRGAEGLAAALAGKALLAPGGMGDFRVLLQGKGLAPAQAAASRRAVATPVRTPTERF